MTVLPALLSMHKRNEMNQRLADISRDFLEAMTTIGRIIISERYVDAQVRGSMRQGEGGGGSREEVGGGEKGGGRGEGMNQRLADISREFLEAIATMGRIVISERYVDVHIRRRRRREGERGGRSRGRNEEEGEVQGR
jgi:hypothetical protein